MVLTNQDSIRDVLLFPAMKPQASAEDSGEQAPEEIPEGSAQ
jgi:aspartyl-tRNA synthetase